VGAGNRVTLCDLGIFVDEELESLMIRALVGICGVTELEMLYSARKTQESGLSRQAVA
jgi:predicted nucleic acid-binding protein